MKSPSALLGKIRQGISLNAPVILGLTGLSAAVLVLRFFAGDLVGRWLAAYYTSFLDPLMYLRLLTHVTVHGDLSHFIGNFMMILLVGPIVEEKYGSRRLVWMMLVTAFITGLAFVLFTRRAMLMGASSIAFMLILLASFTQTREGKIPVTALLVAMLYLGNEVVSAILPQDGTVAVSYVSHIIGGLCGAAFGWQTMRQRVKK